LLCCKYAVTKPCMSASQFAELAPSSRYLSSNTTLFNAAKSTAFWASRLTEKYKPSWAAPSKMTQTNKAAAAGIKIDPCWRRADALEWCGWLITFSLVRRAPLCVNGCYAALLTAESVRGYRSRNCVGNDPNCGWRFHLIRCVAFRCDLGWLVSLIKCGSHHPWVLAVRRCVMVWPLRARTYLHYEPLLS